MLLSVGITEKSFGAKELFREVRFSVDVHEKVGLIGRNGIGKTTLFNILTGVDTDFTGEVVVHKGSVLVSTNQEYSDFKNLTVLEYILSGLPEYLHLTKLIGDFANLEKPTHQQIDRYSEALEQFAQKNYHFIEGLVTEELKNFQMCGYETRRFSTLSGGEKRLTEIVKIIHSVADLALIDEPTNYMDYVAKNKFIEWMNSTEKSVVVISHDRDVLKNVDRIIEIKDGGAANYRGNYDDYLRQNSSTTTAGMQDFETVQRSITNIKAKIQNYKRLKERARDPGTIKQFKRLEEKARETLAELEEVARPTFWVDKESVARLDYKNAALYELYKTKNVRIGLSDTESRSSRIIIKGEDLSIGYDKPLFEHKNFELREGGKLEIRGRNGAGKTTLVNTVLGLNSNAKVFAGDVTRDKTFRVGVYEQEVSPEYFDLTLEAAIEKIYLSQELPITETKIRSLLADYLFEGSDCATPIRNLSGGQKARLQIIKMLSNDPQLIVLDEPTSHLDLPSIEELETALKKYSGAVLYISHDGYFQRGLGGDVLEV